MIKSMTGFGRAEHSTDDLALIVEIKSLNSKYLDTSIKIPKVFSEKEIPLKNLLEKKLERGKISLNIDYQNKSQEQVPQIVNESLFKGYYANLKKIADELNDDKADIFRITLFLPEVIASGLDNEKDMANWDIIEKKINEAIEKCDQFRLEEGAKLGREFKTYINNIVDYLEMIDNLDPERIELIRSRIESNIQNLIPEGDYDQNRFEQELLYYIEKLDISEEKVRLKTHLDYFIAELDNEGSNGKKLNFISQEIGREINTIGSKANYAPITKYVVLMKENLEKIKEQMLNIL